MRVLVTGGAGFIGSHVCAALVESGVSVTVFDDFSTGQRLNLDHLPVKVVEGSILDLPTLGKSCHASDVIVHLAALGSVPRSLEDPRWSFEVNAIGTLNVLEVARSRGSRVIFASSSAVYGSVTTNPRNETLPTRPKSPYGAGKLSAEGLVLAYASAYEMENLALRFFNVYGPRQRPDGPYAAVIPKFISAALQGRALRIFGDGRQSRDFTFVSSIADAVVQSVLQDKNCDLPVNLAFGKATSLLGLVQEIEIVLGRKLSIEFSEPRPGDITTSENDPALMRALFPRLIDVPLQEGLRQTIAYYSAN